MTFHSDNLDLQKSLEMSILTSLWGDEFYKYQSKWTHMQIYRNNSTHIPKVLHIQTKWIGHLSYITMEFMTSGGHCNVILSTVINEGHDNHTSIYDIINIYMGIMVFCDNWNSPFVKTRISPDSRDSPDSHHTSSVQDVGDKELLNNDTQAHKSTHSCNGTFVEIYTYSVHT